MCRPREQSPATETSQTITWRGDQPKSSLMAWRCECSCPLWWIRWGFMFTKHFGGSPFKSMAICEILFCLFLGDACFCDPASTLAAGPSCHHAILLCAFMRLACSLLASGSCLPAEYFVHASPLWGLCVPILSQILLCPAPIGQKFVARPPSASGTA